MALPATISGISTAVAPVGPFKSSANAYYLFGRDQFTATTLQAFKTTTPDISGAWASIASRIGFTTAILNIAAYQVNDVIHMLVQDGTMSTSVATKYVSFDMATDTFLTTTETVAAAAVLTGLATNGWGCSIVVRLTGEAVAFYNGVNTKTTSTYARVYYQRRTGVGAWSAAVQVDANTTRDSIQPGAALGVSDAVHFLFTSPTISNVGVYQRTLSAGNVLQTASTVVTFSLIQQTFSTLPMISYNNAGTQKVVGIAKMGSTSTTFSAVRFDAGNTPAISSSTVITVNTGAGPIAVFNDGTDVYAVYRSSADADLYIVKSTDNGATWGTPVAAYVGTFGGTALDLSRNGRLYQRGSSIVFPYVGMMDSSTRYNEYVVRSVAVAATAPPVFQSPRKVFAFSGRAR